MNHTKPVKKQIWAWFILGKLSLQFKGRRASGDVFTKQMLTMGGNLHVAKGRFQRGLATCDLPLATKYDNSL